MNFLTVIKENDPKLYAYVMGHGETFSDLQLKLYADSLIEKRRLVTVAFSKGGKTYDYLYDYNHYIDIGDPVYIQLQNGRMKKLIVIGIKYTVLNPDITYKYAFPCFDTEY